MGKGGNKTKVPGKAARHDLVRNRKARFEFEILETKEVGLVLRGTEVKSIRAGRASLAESYVLIDEHEEAWWIGGTVEEYPFGNVLNHPPKRKRKLLMRKGELRKLRAAVRERGFTLVPLALYLSPRGILKMEIALARGRRKYDKRQAQQKREAKRDIRRELG